MKKDVAYKSTEMIQLKGNILHRDTLTEVEQKAVMYIASQVKQDSKPEDKYHFAFHNFAQVADLDRSGRLYQDITDTLYGLMSKRIIFRDETAKGKKAANMIISPVFYDSGIIEYKVDENLLPHFKAFAAGFTMIDVADYMRIRGKYPLSLYELMLSWAGKGIVEYKIDELRQKLSVPIDAYPRNTDFVKKVRLAVDEINRKSSKITVKIDEKVGSRRRVDAIVFKITNSNMIKQQIEPNAPALDALLAAGITQSIASQLAKDYTDRRIIGNVDFAKSKSGVKNLPAYIVSAIQEDYAEVEQISLVTQQRQEQETAAKVKAEELAAAQAKALEEEDAARMAPVSHDSPFAKKLKLKKKVTQETPKEEEPAEIKPTIATAAEIVEIERLNHGMTRGKWDCIAGIMNKKLRYNEQLEPWTADTIKKAFLKARKAQA